MESLFCALTKNGWEMEPGHIQSRGTEQLVEYLNLNTSGLCSDEYFRQNCDMYWALELLICSRTRRQETSCSHFYNLLEWPWIVNLCLNISPICHFEVLKNLNQYRTFVWALTARLLGPASMFDNSALDTQLIMLFRDELTLKVMSSHMGNTNLAINCEHYRGLINSKNCWNLPWRSWIIHKVLYWNKYSSNTL